MRFAVMLTVRVRVQVVALYVAVLGGGGGVEVVVAAVVVVSDGKVRSVWEYVGSGRGQVVVLVQNTASE
jgi:hypothetical protein